MPDLNPTEFEYADTYAPGTRIASRLTRRKGTVLGWPDGRAYPPGHGSDSPIRGQVYGAIWVRWDDTGDCHHAWRHQVHRI
jgi:hypothetical protein